ncbi:MAG TPA: hypothetical protein VD932_04740, partial [Aquabacterium sp.]|nr:hypothetical protein [Aquabacterium sp.]
MPTSPPEILELAQFIRDRFLTEAGRRSAISRAYYAARHCTEAAFGTPAGAEHETSHTALIRAVREMGKAPGPARGEAAVIAQFLDVLRRRRNTADYRLDEEVERA